MLTDPRFSEVATLIGGLSLDQLESNRAALQALPAGAELLNPPPLAEPWRLRAFAAVATWGMLAIEAAVALAFLTAAGSRPEWLRHALLLAFCVTTHAFAPVAGFGWLLIVLGLVQTDDTRPGLRGAYVAGFLLVLLYSEVPWASLLQDWVASR